jgi:hypothetical protein
MVALEKQLSKVFKSPAQGQPRKPFSSLVLPENPLPEIDFSTFPE